jgi:hypothetical protein
MAKEARKRSTTGSEATPKRRTPARTPAVTSRTRRAPRVTHEDIALRAYELHLDGGTDAFENWIAAERELAAQV